MVTLPVREDVASVVEDVESVLAVTPANVLVPEADRVVTDTAANVLDPVADRVVADTAANVLAPVTVNVVPTDKEVPTQRLLATPTPPETVTLPVR